MTNRRAFILGLGATLAVIRTPGLLMPIKPVLGANLAVLRSWDQIPMTAREINLRKMRAYIEWGISHPTPRFSWTGDKIKVSYGSAPEPIDLQYLARIGQWIEELRA